MPEQLPDPAYSKDTEHVPKGVFVGLCTLDIVYRVPRLPEPDEKLTPLDQWVVAGGPASNSAVTFSHLGGHSLLATALGRYPPSKLARSELESWGVEVVNLAPEEPYRGEDPYRLPLVTVMVQEDTGQRAILSRGAWGLRLGPGSFDPSWLDAADVLLLDGHLLEAAIAAAELATEQGIPVVLDAGSWKEGLDRLLPLVDHAICGEHFRPPGCRSYAEVFRYLESTGVVERAITRGERSILYRGRGVEAEIEVPPVNAVDTMAAGDIFHGAYAFLLTQEMLPAGALAQAAELASRSCAYFGPRRWMEEAAESP